MESGTRISKLEEAGVRAISEVIKFLVRIKTKDDEKEHENMSTLMESHVTHQVEEERLQEAGPSEQ